MILHLNNDIPAPLLRQTADALDARYYGTDAYIVFVTGATVRSTPDALAPYCIAQWVFDSDVQLSSRLYHPATRSIAVGDTVIGGDSSNTLLIAGPCAVESRRQIEQSAQMLVSLGLHTLRAGCFKPRTSPYSFQGMGMEGLMLLREMKRRYGLTIVTEARDASNIDAVIDVADVIQIGTKSMFDYSLLSACGHARKPILLKRNYGATLKEFLLCAESIMSHGNHQVILCERGIRSFETSTRFTLDLCGVAWLKEHTSLPIVVDPSHAMGYAYGIPDLARACTAMGIDGLLIETHPDPASARSDARQQLDHTAFRTMHSSLSAIADAVHRHIL